MAFKCLSKPLNDALKPIHELCFFADVGDLLKDFIKGV